MKKILSLLFMCIIFAQCSKEETQPIYSNPERPIVKNRFKVEIDEALKIAENAPSVFGEVDTKASLKEVGDIDVITTFETKGNNKKDTLMYIINYKNQMGYTFISADDRCGGILAYIKEGNFKLNDKSNNGLSTYLYTLIKNNQISKRININNPVEKKISTKDLSDVNKKEYSYLRPKYEHPGEAPETCNRLMRNTSNIDYTTTYGGRKNHSYYITKGCIASRRYTKTKVNVYPLLNTNWGQGAPFNDDAPIIEGKHAWAGCVAMAGAQVMAYHNFPKYYPSDINNGRRTCIESLRKCEKGSDFTSTPAKRTIAEFIRTIGNLYENNWGLNGTSAFTNKGCDVFEKMGYPRPCNLITYSTYRTTNSLDNNRPVIIEGFNESSGHSWVIDGYITITKGEDVYYFDEYLNINDIESGKYNEEIESTYLSCNFGWNGNRNGYYLEEIFDTNAGGTYPYKTKTKYKYTRNINIIPDIHK